MQRTLICGLCKEKKNNPPFPVIYARQEEMRQEDTPSPSVSRHGKC